MRGNATGPEKLLWAALRSRRAAHLKFRRQHPLGAYIVDFYCPAHRLAIELDGNSHQGRADYDAARTSWLTANGIRVLRIENDDVLCEIDCVLEGILRACGIDPDHFISPTEE
ncbi:MAG: endonuclease domain-containing protein [Planctomycetaceae bacterium]|nr:endonuclease domain-containing protein [Planctomycetaceae bacterium]